MSKRTLKLWKRDSPQPEWYDKVEDPLHRVDSNFGCDELQTLKQNLTQALKSWVENPKAPFEAVTNRLKADWLQDGGSLANYEIALSQAFLASGYYKNFK